MNDAVAAPSRVSEETLDPTNWAEVRALGHRMIDDLLAGLQNVRKQAVWRPIPDEHRRALQDALPQEPTGLEEVYQDYMEYIRPYPHGNIHPRFWGWVNGSGTVAGIFGDLLASGMNSSAAFGDQAAVLVEMQVVDWMKEVLGFPSTATGNLTSGCSVANLSALAAARDAMSGFDVGEQGLACSEPRLLVYGSQEVHSSSRRALEVLGLGRQCFRSIPIDAEHRIVVAELRRALAADRSAGHRPIAILGNAGTVNVGAFDDLEALADVAAEEDIWLHVDAAFGAMVALAPELKGRLAGAERADSLAFDLHKWMHVPYDAGMVLYRNPRDPERSFHMRGDYITNIPSGVTTGPTSYLHRGVQMSRGFRALKVWFTLRHHGVNQLGRLVQQNVDQARYLVERVDAHQELERLGPAALHIVCFRYRAPDAKEAELDSLNRKILVDLQNSGVAAPSHTVIGGRFALRVSITNHRTRREDLDILVEEVVRRGRLA